MKAGLVTFGLFVFCSGLVTLRGKAIEPVGAVDAVSLKNNYGGALPVGSTLSQQKARQLVAFVNALPQKWKTPWYGPPIGKLYFEFYLEGQVVGNFYAGPNFFGRDRGGFFSQNASRKQIDQLSAIVAFDVWVYLHEKRP